MSFSHLSIVLSFSSLPLILAVPYFFGEFIEVIFFRKSLREYLLSLNISLRWFIRWLIGIYSMSTLATVLQFIGAFKIFYYILLLGVIFGFMVSYKHYNCLAFSFFRENWWPFIFSWAISIVPAVIASIFIPFPLFGINHDAPRYIVQPVLRIIEDNYLQLSTRVSEVLLTSLAALIFKLDPLCFLWSARFILYIIFSTGVFLFVYSNTKDRVLSLITVLVSSYINMGGQNPLLMLFFDVPAQHFRGNTILFSIFPFALFFIEKSLLSSDLNSRELTRALLTLNTITFVLFFYFVFPENYFGLPSYYKLLNVDPIILPLLLLAGVLIEKIRFSKNSLKNYFHVMYIITLGFFAFHREETLLFLLTISIYSFLRLWLKEWLNKSEKPYILILLISLSILMEYIGNNLGLPTIDLRGIIRTQWPIDFSLKCDELIYGNSILTTLFFIVGIILALISRNNFEISITTITLIILSFYFLPIPWTYRFFKELSIFEGYIIAFAIHKVINSISKCSVRKIISSLMLVILAVSLAYPIFYRFSYSLSLFSPELKYQTLITDEEYQLALFIREEMPGNIRIISDYFSMWVLTPLSNKIWIIDKFMNLEEMTNEEVEKIQYIKNNIFLAKSSKEAYKAILGLEKNFKEPFDEADYIRKTGKVQLSFIIVLSRRTSSWVKKEGYYGLTFDIDTHVDQNLLRLFEDERFFTPLYNINDKIYAFQVNLKYNFSETYISEGRSS